MTRIGFLFLCASTLTFLTVGCVTAQPKGDGFVSLFDGKNILFKPLPPGKGPAAKPVASKPASTDKTLVSWVTTSNKSLRGGSVLTVQEEDKFDGIVFAELAPARWMAGSNFYRRTNKNQRDYAEEEAGAATIVQLAMVYKGDRILLYRNGELYASHTAKNIDLLSSKNNIAVFGLRHVGGGGSFGGSIDDARSLGDIARASRPEGATYTSPGPQPWVCRLPPMHSEGVARTNAVLPLTIGLPLIPTIAMSAASFRFPGTCPVCWLARERCYISLCSICSTILFRCCIRQMSG